MLNIIDDRIYWHGHLWQPRPENWEPPIHSRKLKIVFKEHCEIEFVSKLFTICMEKEKKQEKQQQRSEYSSWYQQARPHFIVES